MVAETIRSQIRNSWGIRVTAEWVRFNVGGGPRDLVTPSWRFMYQLPARAYKAIKDYDDDIEVKPFMFNLDGRQGMSAEVVRTGERGPYRKRKKSAQRSKRVIRHPYLRLSGAAIVREEG
jgi:hypothetical protein